MHGPCLSLSFVNELPDVLTGNVPRFTDDFKISLVWTLHGKQHQSHLATFQSSDDCELIRTYRRTLPLS